jgi:uncharacterized protein (TIGR00288 family)
MAADEERIALFIDYENLAIGTRDKLGIRFDFKPVAAALAERGRVVVRRAYADWSMFGEDRRMLTKNHVELIEIPQRMGAVRKNAADIKMAVDAIELAFDRDYLTTFVICTGDSDFTPLVHKLREMNKRVIGVGVKASTSALLPPACDEFIFYELLDGVEISREARQRSRPRHTEPPKHPPETMEEAEAAAEAGDIEALGTLVTQTLAGLQRNSGDVVRASSLKRALLRKDPTFSEANYGFRSFGEMLRFLSTKKAIEISEGHARGDPEVGFPEQGSAEAEAFAALRTIVQTMETKGTTPIMSGLKHQLRKRMPDFTERKYGYSGFLQFCKAANNSGYVDLKWNDEAEDYVLSAAPASGNGRNG